MTKNNQALYFKIYTALLDSIKNQKYKIGDLLPSESELSKEYDVSRITSKKALDMLSENGYAKRMRGKGSYVIEYDGERKKEDLIISNDEVRTSLIGVVLNDFSESYGVELLSGIEREATKNGLYIVLRRSYGNQSEEDQSIDALLRMGVKGIIIMSVHGENFNPKILRLILDGFPVVLVDRHIKGVPSAFIGTDNIDASKMAIEYLLDLGHRKISVMSPPPINTSALEDRIEGIVIGYSKHKVAIDESLWITDLSSTIPGNKGKENITKDTEKIKNLLINNPEITCIFATEYDIALIAVEIIKEIGKKIPEDISILCFDGPYNYLGKYFLTHIRQNEFEIGKGAVRLIIDQISESEKQEKVNKIFLSANLVIGSSTKELIKSHNVL